MCTVANSHKISISEHSKLLRYDALLIGKWLPTFWKRWMPPSRGFKFSKNGSHAGKIVIFHCKDNWFIKSLGMAMLCSGYDQGWNPYKS
jgi:hypothetical protein